MTENGQAGCNRFAKMAERRKKREAELRVKNLNFFFRKKSVAKLSSALLASQDHLGKFESAKKLVIIQKRVKNELFFQQISLTFHKTPVWLIL